MGAAVEVFRIVGTISWQNMDKAYKELDAFNKAAKDVATQLGKMAKAADKAGLQLSHAFTAPLAAVGALALKTGDYADKVLSLEQSTGLSTNSLQEFAHIATVAGGSSDALFATISALTGKLPDIAARTGDAAVAFKELGIDVLKADGSYRNMDAILPEVLQKLQQEQDQTKRNVLAFQVFGKASKEVTHFLGMNSEEMARLRNEAHSLGLVMDREGLESANKFRIGVTNLKAQFAAIGREIAVNVMPILNDTLVPLIQTTLIPMFRDFAGALEGLAHVFAGLSTGTQQWVIVVGAVVAALGPLLLIGGKVLGLVKGLIGLLPALKGIVLATTGAFKGLAVAMGVTVSTLGAVALAIGAVLLPLGVYISEQKKLNQLKKEAKELEIQRNTTDVLYGAAKGAGELVERYKELKNTAPNMYDEKELRRYVDAHVDAVVALKNHARAMQNLAPLNELEIEDTRRRIYALHGITEARKEEVNADKQRKDDLAALVKEHRDAIDQMTMSEEELLRKQESAALAKAQALKATDAETDIIAESFYLKRKELMDKEAEEERKAVEEKEKIRAAADKEWENRLLQQSGNRKKILEAEYAEKLAEAVESGAAIAKVEEYYANERAKMQEEAERPWKEKLAEQGAAKKKALAEQSGNARTILEAELADRQAKLQAAYANDIAEAGKSGAKKALIDQYYENEMTALAEEGARQRVEIRKREVEQAAAFAVSSVNKLGSVLAGFSQNEQKSIERDYKERKEALDAHFDAEEARIKASVTDEKERDAQLSALEEQRSARSTALQEEADAKKLELQRANAKREKALGIFNAVINTAQAVVSALKAGPVMGPIMAGVIGALGAAEIGVIMSEPEPFATGAMIQGGRGGVHGLVGEGKQDELILPMETGVEKLAKSLANKTGCGESVSNVNYTININAGTLVADDYSAKQFARKINAFIVADNARRGIA